MSAIEQELQKLTSVKPNTGEDRNDYLSRLVDAVGQASDDDWEGLSKEAQDWVNKATKATNSGDDSKVPDFPDATTKERKDDMPPSKKKASASNSKSSAPTKKKAASPDKKKAAPEKKAASERSPRKGVGAQAMIKKLVFRDPSISTDDLCEKLNKAGYKPSRLAVSTIRSGFRHSLKVIQDEGHLKNIKL